MALTSQQVSALRRRQEELRRALAGTGDMRRGSLVGRYRRCGKPTCHCAQAGDRGHGPSWSLTWRVGGKTQTRVLPAGAAVEQARVQLAEYRQFRARVRELVEVSERLCEAQVHSASGAADEAAEKGGSRRASRRRSAARSRPSSGREPTRA